MSFEWDRPPEEVFGELGEAYAQAIHNGVLQIAQRYAPEIEAWMKTNASWEDRTGNARQSLIGDVEDIANQAVILIMSHGVEYGTFLELANAGKYAVVTPALDTFIPKVWNDVKILLS